MFEVEGSVGIFAWGAVLGWVLMFFITRNQKNAKGIVTLLGFIGATTFLTWVLNNKLLDEYFLGVAVGFFSNIIVRVIGKIIPGIKDAIAEITVYKGLRL